jgi:hypothetical protein
MKGWRFAASRFWEMMLEEELGDDDVALRLSLQKRLEGFKTCGKAVSVRRCDGCGMARGGSGTFRGTRTCKTKACPVCARLRAQRYSDWVGTAWNAVTAPPGRKDYAWRWLTLTTKFDPYSEDDCSWSALRARARACASASSKVWERLLSSGPGTGAIRTIEVSRRGMVHANILYFGPPLDLAKVEALAKKVSPIMGHAHLEKVSRNVIGKKGDRKKSPKEQEEEFEEDEDPRGSLEGLKKVARYISKGLDHECRSMDLQDEDWVTGESVLVTASPLLAVRWEFATYRMHLTQRYGALRGLDLDEHGEDSKPENEDDAHIACSCCGTVGSWRTSFVSTDRWFRECHDRGVKALHATPDTWSSRTWQDQPPDDPL